jgi:hypothetical protein
MKFGLITLLLPLLLYVASIPGVLMRASRNAKCDEQGNAQTTIINDLGRCICVIGYLYIYLGYLISVVHWTSTVISKKGADHTVWFIAFFMVVLPMILIAIFNNVMDSVYNPLKESQNITAVVVTVAFIAFIFTPRLLDFFYHWHLLARLL